jgi:Dockerin type I domain/FG-GAP-like repeat
VGDFNRDGNPDLATANSGANNVSVLLGTGTGGFGAATTSTPTNTPTNTLAPTETATNTPTDTATIVPTDTPTFTHTPTSTHTQTETHTPTPAPTNTPATMFVGHVIWQGRPAQPNGLQQLPITLTLKSGTTEVNYPVQNTDASGFFTQVVTLPNGTYDWRVKGAKFLANSGTANLSGAPQTNVEMGLMRAGDCNNDNVISVQDFNILKNTFGKANGDPGYDARADFNGDNAVSVQDFNLLKGNFGQGGSPSLGPGLP